MVLIITLPAVAGTTRHDVKAEAYDAIGSLFQESVGRFSVVSSAGRTSGSGTLIGRDWVLTAAHVVDDASTLDYSLNGNTYAVSQWLVPQAWQGNPLSGEDVALVKLDEPATEGAVIPIYRGVDEVGRPAVSVGFGLTGNGFTGYQHDTPLEIRGGTNTIDAEVDPAVLLTDFDSPFASHYFNRLGYPLPTAYETALAPGDSGGALLLRNGEQWELVGVNSFGVGLDGEPDASYGDLSGYTRVSSHQHWIDLILRTTPEQLASQPIHDSEALSAIRTFSAARPVPQPTAVALGGFLVVLSRLRRSRSGGSVG